MLRQRLGRVFAFSLLLALALGVRAERPAFAAPETAMIQATPGRVARRQHGQPVEQPGQLGRGRAAWAR